MEGYKMDREHRGKSVIEFPNEYVVIDIETTGLSTEYNDIIEFGALKVVNDEVVDSFQSLVQPPIRYMDPYTDVTNENYYEVERPDGYFYCYVRYVELSEYILQLQQRLSEQYEEWKLIQDRNEKLTKYGGLLEIQDLINEKTFCPLHCKWPGIRISSPQEVVTFIDKYGNPPEGYSLYCLEIHTREKGVEFVDPFIESLTGITNEMLENAPGIETVMPQFLKFVGDAYVLGHNVGFDVNFIYDNVEDLELPHFSNPWINTLRISKKLFPDEKHHRLCDLVERFNLSPSGEHRALADCYTTLDAYRTMKGMIDDEDEFKNSFIRSHSNRNYLKAADIIGDSSLNNPDSPLYEKYVVFTGALEKFVRKEAMQIVANLGGINQDSVTKKTNYLILGDNSYCSTIKDGKSSKQKKAEELIQKGYDLQIMPETVFYDMILGEE